MRLDISSSQPLFGPPAALYGPVVAGIIPRMADVQYRFWDNDSVLKSVAGGAIGAAEFNGIAATELLLSAHLAAITSLVRASRWFEATWLEYQGKNLLGWAACCRSLLEAVGDTIDGLGSMGADLAENLSLLMRAMTGLDEGILDLAPLEEKMIHFSHARKIPKAEKSLSPSSHVARPTFEYIAILQSAGLAASAALYAELCEIGHPARSSVSWMYVPVDGGFRINPDRDTAVIRDIVARYCNSLHLLPSLAFNPGLLILRVLVKFGFFPHVPELKGFSFQGAKGWGKIKPLLAGAPTTLKRNPLVDQMIAATTT